MLPECASMLAHSNSYQVRVITYTLVGVWGRLAAPKFLFVLRCAAKPRTATQTISD